MRKVYTFERKCCFRILVVPRKSIKFDKMMHKTIKYALNANGGVNDKNSIQKGKFSNEFT